MLTAKIHISKKTLIRLYFKRKMSLSQIADKYGLCVSTIKNYLNRYGLQCRTPANALCTDLAGKKIGNWEVTNRKGYRDTAKGLHWLCMCSLCRQKYWVAARSLYTKTSRNCLACARKLRYKGYKSITGTQWETIKTTAQLTKREFKITINYIYRLFIKQNGRCALSGIPLKFGYKRDVTASLDRIDNSKGYIKGNIQWVHKDINRMKWAHDQDYFIWLCKQITKHQRKFDKKSLGS